MAELIFPKAQSLGRPTPKQRKKAKEITRKHYILTCNHCHPSTTESLASLKVRSATCGRKKLQGEMHMKLRKRNGVFSLNVLMFFFLFCFSFSIPERGINFFLLNCNKYFAQFESTLPATAIVTSLSLS